MTTEEDTALSRDEGKYPTYFDLRRAAESSASDVWDRSVDVDTTASQLARGVEDHPATTPPSGAEFGGGSRALIGLARWHPGMAYFLFLADCHESKDSRPHARFLSMRSRSPRLYRACVVIDLLTMAAVLIAMLALGGLLAWKTFLA